MTRPDWTLPRMSIRPWMEPRSAHPPGIAPLDPADWLYHDATDGPQLALRDALMAQRPAQIAACLPEGAAAAEELRDHLVAELTARHGARLDGTALIRADGGRVPLGGPAIHVIARLAPEDFLILDRRTGQEHVLVAGALAFPSSWRLLDKIGRALMRIHLPVAEYGPDLGARVQRLHDGIRPGRMLWRANWNFALVPEMCMMFPEAEKIARRVSRADPGTWEAGWIRVERQTLMRLPVSGAVVFGLRTLIAPLTGCTDEDWAGIHRALSELPEAERHAKAGPSIRAEAARRAATMGLA